MHGHHLETHFTEILRILAQEWDPLQIKGNPEMEKEYAVYVNSLCTMLMLKKSRTEIISYLWEIETQIMELKRNYTHTKEIVRKLFAFGEKNMHISHTQ
jgi:hypothetical protein